MAQTAEFRRDRLLSPALIPTMAAKRIVELAKDGECNPDRLCEQVLSEVRGLKFQQQELFDVRRDSFAPG